MHDLVSVVIPCYNAEETLGEAIESALVQTHPFVEVIVIDDGSTDNSLSIVQNFSGRVRLWRQENLGGCSARNRGVELAQGEWIQFLDADDLLDRDKINRQLPMVRRYPNDTVYCDYRRVDSDGCIDKSLSSPPVDEDDAVVFILKHYGITTSTPIHSRERLLRVDGFREALPCSQERDLHLRLACAGHGFRFHAEKLITIRKKAGSVSEDFVRVLREHRGIADHAIGLLQGSGNLTDRRRAAFAGFLARDARAFLQRGYRSEAMASFRQAREIHRRGGLDWAYDDAARMLARCVGPEVAERLVSVKRKWFSGGARV